MMDVMTVLVTLWGARLTFNFARKGGYAKGGEDYRWALLRSKMSGWHFQVFNLVLIAFYQSALLEYERPTSSVVPWFPRRRVVRRQTSPA